MKPSEAEREHEWLRDLLVWADSPEVRRVPCPGSTEAGCRCVEHHPGGLVPQRVRLNVVTLGDPSPATLPARCSGDAMVCVCERHAGEREEAIARQLAARKLRPAGGIPIRRSRPDALAA